MVQLVCTSWVQVDFLSFTGQALTTSNATLAAVLGSNAQAMTAMATAHNLLSGLLVGEVTEVDIASSVVQAVYDTIKQLNSSKSALATKAGLNQLYKAAYASLAALNAANKPKADRRLLGFAADASQLEELFVGTAEVSDRMWAEDLHGAVMAPGTKCMNGFSVSPANNRHAYKSHRLVCIGCSPVSNNL